MVSKNEVKKLKDRVENIPGVGGTVDAVVVITLTMDEHGMVTSARETISAEEHARRYPDADPDQPINVNFPVLTDEEAAEIRARHSIKKTEAQ